MFLFIKGKALQTRKTVTLSICPEEDNGGGKWGSIPTWRSNTMQTSSHMAERKRKEGPKVRKGMCKF